MNPSLKHFTAFILLLTLFSSCRKDKSVSLDEEQAIDLLSASISDKGQDVQEETKSLHNAVLLAQFAECGNEVDYSFSWSRTWGTRSYERSVNGVRTTLCENDELSGFQFDANFVANFQGPNWESNGTGSSTGTLTGFNTTEENYFWSGQSTKSAIGTIIQNGEDVETQVNFDSDLFIHKEDHEITSGTSNFSLTGAGENVESFSYSGVINFIGNRQAIVSMNGNDYSISW
jgi:hypothetical protein